jgi:hypothetical protein
MFYKSLGRAISLLMPFLFALLAHHFLYEYFHLQIAGYKFCTYDSDFYSVSFRSFLYFILATWTSFLHKLSVWLLLNLRFLSEFFYFSLTFASPPFMNSLLLESTHFAELDVSFPSAKVVMKISQSPSFLISPVATPRV